MTRYFENRRYFSGRPPSDALACYPMPQMGRNRKIWTCAVFPAPARARAPARPLGALLIWVSVCHSHPVESPKDLVNCIRMETILRSISLAAKRLCSAINREIRHTSRMAAHSVADRRAIR